MLSASYESQSMGMKKLNFEYLKNIGNTTLKKKRRIIVTLFGCRICGGGPEGSSSAAPLPPLIVFSKVPPFE